LWAVPAHPGLRLVWGTWTGEYVPHAP
jgi:hypothetical protein